MSIKICIAGLTASGKTTLGNALEKELGIKHINPSYKDSEKTTDDLIKFLENIKPSYVKSFDKRIINLANGKDCIISTWHGPWIIKDATIRVWLDVSEEERAKRWAKAHNISLAEARNLVHIKDELTKRQFKLAYKKDMDMSVFDLHINYEKVTMLEAIAIISMLAIARSKSQSKK
jgi:cytidylate kinase